MKIKHVTLIISQNLTSYFLLVDPSLITKSSPPSTISSSSRRPSVPLQITLRNPPIRRRLLNGSNISNSLSPTGSPSEFFSPPSKSSSQTSEPPPIPPRCSLINTTNKHYSGQFIHSDETTIQTECNNNQSKNFRRKKSSNSRSDSVDAVSISSSRQYHRQISNEQGANSD
jgi:hypothetical protein